MGAAIDLYCERNGIGFWAEPFNAVNNAAFLLAMVWALVEIRRRRPGDWRLIGLSLLAGCIGIGSFLFHTFATGWAAVADVVPIWTFVALYVVEAVLRMSGVSPRHVLGVALGGIAVGIALYWIFASGAALDGAWPRPVPTARCNMRPLCWRWPASPRSLKARHAQAGFIAGAAALFVLSLALPNCIDPLVCAALPISAFPLASCSERADDRPAAGADPAHRRVRRRLVFPWFNAPREQKAAWSPSTSMTAFGDAAMRRRRPCA